MLPGPHPAHMLVLEMRSLFGTVRRPLPADDLTIALYFQSLMDNANSFSTIKSASASIASFHKINLIFTNHPIMALEVCIVRTAAARKFGLSAKRGKEHFL